MYNRPWAVVFLFSFHATVDLRHRLGMWIIFYFLYIPRRYHRSEPLYLFLLTFIYVYNTLLGLGKYFCFLGKLVLNSNTKGFRALEFFRVKAFDWKISYWTFCCTVLVSILSCLFDSRRRCDKIKGFFEYSATLHFKTCHDLFRVNLHFFERHNQSQKLFPQSLRVSGYPGIRVYSHQNQKGTEII